ncbi:YdcH family protein [Paracoccus sp. (in: a-proteobacteria)]|uniref:YdcH family protein n=1 Tax=Paracoccus sp. TaxID=267 RepID=UPI0026E0AA2D|nr:DUF465 domain-containing protein [Paracoccus sp. (in: a-proteobacteria)]MDO5646681.1 DUF465 domain-containing protein [Paracoccus sp. (in: a-proteobacteria)]
MATPHAIHEEFPNDADRIHNLKISNAHFARLLQEYDEVNDQVHNAEALIHPISEDAEKQLRRQRAHLKDEIAHMMADKNL